MTLETVRRWLRPWRLWRERKKVEPAPEQLARAIPDFAEALALERDSLKRGYTRGVAKARKAKKAAVRAALQAGKPRVRVRATGVRVKV